MSNFETFWHYEKLQNGKFRVGDSLDDIKGTYDTETEALLVVRGHNTELAKKHRARGWKYSDRP